MVLDKAASVPPAAWSLNKGSQVAVDDAHVHHTVVPWLQPTHTHTHYYY